MTAVKLPCPVCNEGTLRGAHGDVWMEGIKLGRFRLTRCTTCFAEFIDEANGRALEEAYDRAVARGALGATKGRGRRVRASGPSAASRRARGRKTKVG